MLIAILKSYYKVAVKECSYQIKNKIKFLCISLSGVKL